MRQFHEQLQDLLQRVALMGTMSESMIQWAVTALATRNEKLSKEVFAKEREVNALQVDIDDRAVKLTALQQPVGQDVRFLFMASRIGGELERIADQAVNICQNLHYVLESPAVEPPLKLVVDIPIMAEIVQKMVRQSLNSMVNRDVSLADSVLEEENKVDAFRDQVFRTMVENMSSETGGLQRGLSLILIARNLERIGDHATNIAEEVIYWIQGRDVRHGNGATTGNGRNGNGAVR